MAADVTISASGLVNLLKSNIANTVVNANYLAGTYTLGLSNDTFTVVNNSGGSVSAVLSNGDKTLTISGAVSSLALDNVANGTTFNLQSLAHPTTVTSITNDTVNLGTGGVLTGVNADVSIVNTGGTRALLRALNTTDPSPRNVTIANSSITGVTPANIFVDTGALSASSLIILDGNANVSVQSTNITLGLSISSLGGSNRFKFSDQAGLGSGNVSVSGSNNLIDYSAYTTPIHFSATAGTATGVGSVVGFQSLWGGSAGDTIVMGNEDGTVLGLGGDDSITLGAGSFQVNSGPGDDTITGGISNTYVWDSGDGNTTVLVAGSGTNVVNITGSITQTDDFGLISSGSNSVASLAGSPIFSIPTNGFASFNINGLGGADSLTIDFSAGNPIGAAAFSFDGGTGFDTLNMKGGQFTNEVYHPTLGVYGSGWVDLDTTRINFANLSPINDIVGATNFDFTLPNVPNALAILNGPTYSSTATTQLVSQMPSPTFELINVGNKTNVRLVSPFAGDTIVLNNATPGAGMQTLGVTATANGSSLRSFAAPNGVATNVFLGGNDVATISAAGIPTTGSFTVNGGLGINTLNIDGTGTTSAPIVGATTITIGSRVLNYLNFQSILISNAASTPPTIVSAPPFTAVAGTALVDKVIGTFTSNTPGLTADNFGASITWGDGTSTAGVITQDASDPTLFYVSGSHTYQGGFGTRTVGLSVRSLGGTSTTVVNGSTVTIQSQPSTPVSTNLQATIADAAITAQGAPVAALENLPFTGVIVATFSTPDLGAVAGNYTATIDWGDTTGTSAGTITASGTTPNGVTFVVTGGHTYGKEGTHTITVRISSAGGSEAVATSTATVADGSISVIGNAVTATAGTPLATQVIALISDSGGIEPPNSYTAVVNWGDGQAASIPVVVFNGTFLQVLASHKFEAPGSYIGSVTVWTAGGSVNSASFPINVVGLSATNLPVTATEDQPLNNVALISLASNGGPALQPTFYSASIDWGDATAPKPGAITSTGQVLGSHTYDEAGTYSVKITIAGDGNPNLLVYTRSLVVTDVPIIVTGKLDPASDSGISNSDGITNVVQPLYVGTSEPLSTVTVTATPVGGGAGIVLGTTTTDTSGAWKVWSNVALADGSYTVTAEAVDRNGATHGTGSFGQITIDTIGPKVDYLTFNRMKGEIDTWLSDERSGLAQRTIIDNANFSLTKPHNRPGRLLFTSLTASAQTTPTAAQQITGLINGGQPLRGSTYTYTVGDGITDVAGNKLDGEFYGYFPSGNGKAGGDFVAIIDTFHGKVFPAKPSQGFGSPNVPPGTLAQGYSISHGEIVADAKVTNLFKGQVPGGVYAVKKLAPVKAQAQVVAPKAKVTKVVAKPVVQHKVTVVAKPAAPTATAYDKALASLARSRG